MIVKSILLSFLHLMLAVVTFTNADTFTKATPDLPYYCALTFSDFAYNGPRDFSEPLMLPQYPWEKEPALAAFLNENHYELIEIGAVHQVNDYAVLWLRAKQNQKTIWLAFSPETGQIRVYDGTLFIEDQEMFVSSIYISSYGDIWGLLQRVYPLSASHYPLLAKLNLETRQFILPPDSPMSTSSTSSTIVFDGDIFWLFIEKDGIFRYIPQQSRLIEIIDMPSLDRVLYTAVGIDGSIYYQTALQQPPIYHLNEESIFRYDSQTDTVHAIGSPEEIWPLNRGLFVDNSGRLWIGSIGYWTPEGNWHLLYTSVEDYNNLPIQYHWASPEPVFESSDGKLWFSNFWDGGYNFQGTAWYNPETGEGCMFTNSASTLQEDSQQRIWMVTQGELYRARLSDL